VDGSTSPQDARAPGRLTGQYPLNNAMSITPCTPAGLSRGEVQTWVNSQWKILARPGQFSAEINSLLLTTGAFALIERFLASIDCHDIVSSVAVDKRVVGIHARKRRLTVDHEVERLQPRMQLDAAHGNDVLRLEAEVVRLTSE
jgi:hypothetical protein